jgi:hypothetical protein
MSSCISWGAKRLHEADPLRRAIGRVLAAPRPRREQVRIMSEPEAALAVAALLCDHMEDANSQPLEAPSQSDDVHAPVASVDRADHLA